MSDLLAECHSGRRYASRTGEVLDESGVSVAENGGFSGHKSLKIRHFVWLLKCEKTPVDTAAFSVGDA